MIVLGMLICTVIFAVVGWSVSVEMFQQRAWRRRVEAGDVPMVAALLEEAMAGWRRARPPRGVPASLWAGVQGAQLIAVSEDAATVSTSAEPEFRTEEGKRVQVATALDSAVALAARLADMLLYDVPNLRLRSVRVDVYATFPGAGGPEQLPILTVTAPRSVADGIDWDALTAAELMGRFGARHSAGPSGQGEPIALTAPEGHDPADLPPPGPAEGS